MRAATLLPSTGRFIDLPSVHRKPTRPRPRASTGPGHPPSQGAALGVWRRHHRLEPSGLEPAGAECCLQHVHPLQSLRPGRAGSQGPPTCWNCRPSHTLSLEDGHTTPPMGQVGWGIPGAQSPGAALPVNRGHAPSMCATPAPAASSPGQRANPLVSLLPPWRETPDGHPELMGQWDEQVCSLRRVERGPFSGSL